MESKFKIGDSVVISAYGTRCYSNGHNHPHSVTGTVISFSPDTANRIRWSIFDTESSYDDSCLELVGPDNQEKIAKTESFFRKYIGKSVYKNGLEHIKFIREYSSYYEAHTLFGNYKVLNKYDSVYSQDDYTKAMTQVRKPFLGCNDMEPHGLKSRVVNWLESTGDFEPDVLRLYWPNVLKDNETGIAAWLSAKDRTKGKDGRTTVKTGKLFRKMNPLLSDVAIEKLVDKYRADFAEKSFELMESKDQESFKEAYLESNQAPMENPRTTSKRKALGNSCMRWDFSHLDFHPVEAYGSGDFTIFAAKENGKIASRSVVFTNAETPSYGPIYGVSEQSIDFLSDLFESRGFAQADSGSWTGAKLLSLEHGGGYCLPYLDIEPKGVRSKGDYFVITEDRYDYELTSTDGLYGENSCSCDNCGDHTNEDESYYHNDQNLCESCYNDVTIYCSYYEETRDSDGSDEVVTAYRNGRVRTQLWCQDAIENHASYIEGENAYWSNELVSTTADGDLISQREYENDYFTSDNGEIYPLDQMAETKDGETIALCELPDEYIQDKTDSKWYNPESIDQDAAIGDLLEIEKDAA